MLYKEPRCAHLVCGDVDETVTAAAVGSPRRSADIDVEDLSRKIGMLQDRLDTLQRFNAYVE